VQWAANQNSMLTNAISAFQSNGVEIVSIMHGTNDAFYGREHSTGVYKSSMQNIIDSLL
jgi:hypothetical protein